MHISTEQWKVGLIVGQYVLLPVAVWATRHIFNDVVRTAVREEIAPLDKKIDKHIEDDEAEFRTIRDLVMQKHGGMY